MAENTLGRNQVFAIKNADGTPFHDLVLHKATYDSVVMSLGDKITGDVYYRDNNLNVTMGEYIEFKRDTDNANEEPVKFLLISPPTIIKEGMVSDNSELRGMTKYSFEFYHPMYKLGNMPLTDIAVTSSEEKYLSQNKTFFWCGTGNEFIAKLNANLYYSEWVVVASTNEQSAQRLAMMPSDVPTKKAGEQGKSNVLSFDKNTIADGLKTIYDTWDIPFVIDTLHQGEYYDANGNDYYSADGGNKRFVVVVGMPSNEIIDTESGAGVVVQATSLATGNIYYNPQPINAQKGKKIIVESLTDGATPIILNSSHNGVIGTEAKTFESDMTIYVGLYSKSGSVRYIYDGDEEDIFVFRYGQGVGLKNNSRTPRNNKIITRISASGSEDNIPYGYPQIQWTGSDDDPRLKYPLYKGIVGGQYVTLIKHPFTRTRLMPSVYVDCVNKKVNPNNPQYDQDIELVDYYDADNTYENPVVASSPSYEIHEFDGIKPELNRQLTIQGAVPLNDDLTVADSWVDDLKPDSDEYAQRYFRITLPPLGFDVYACASVTQQMQINMRGGDCIGCTFEIQVDWEDYKQNFYDSDGNFDPVIGNNHPRNAEKYPNSTASQINVTVKKEISTFGTLMPNIYQQPHSGDSFVILGISLPTSYITDAQHRLDETAKQYMRENNIHYFDYPLKFDEYFLAKHLSILRQIRTNTIVRFDYAGQILNLCVKQITIKFGEKALPQYNITLTDNIEVVLNQISQIANDVSRISTMAYQNAKQAQSGIGKGNAQDKLSKVSDDTASGLITFLKGITARMQSQFENLAFSGVAKSDGAINGFTDGHGIFMDASNGLIETDGMNVRGFMRVMELIINRLQLMDSDYSFTEGGTVEHIDYEDNGQTIVLTMHKDHENDYTPFYEGDIIYAKINDLLPQGSAVPDGHTATKNGSHYTSWMRVKSVDLTNNKLRVELYAGKKPNGDNYVPSGINFSPYGTAIDDTSIVDEMQAEFNTIPQGATEALGVTGYDTMLTVTRHGNVADSTNPQIKALQIERQQAWVLSTTDKRLSFFWNVDEPIIHDENYALCLGILPDLANLPSTRDRSMPSLYVNTVFYDNRFEANYQPSNIKVDRGQWSLSPAAIYTGETGSRTPDGTLDSSIANVLGWTGSSELSFTEGQTINEPYHCNNITRNTWLTYRLKPSYDKYSDADLYNKICNVFGKDHETSRAWRNGKLWECLSEATNERPSFACTDWVLVSGNTAWGIDFVSSNGNMFYQGHVETNVTAHLFWGDEDITSEVGASAFAWTRSTEEGKTAADTAWDNMASHSGTNELSLSNADMPTAWSRTNRAIFTCTAIVSDGDSQMVIQNQIVA